MTIEKIREALSAKITSLEQLQTILKEHRIGHYNRETRGEATFEFGAKYQVLRQSSTGYMTDYMEYFNAPDLGVLYRLPDPWRARMDNRAPLHLWWLLRERLRMIFGVYPSHTSMLEHLSANAAFAPFAVHISVNDRARIAYTASAADGEADRQVVTTLGKFLKKHILTLSDEEIQAIDASHRAELSTDLEVLTGADNLVHVYRNMVGDSGCMRYSPNHFNLPAHLHPSMAYDAPGFGVAVLRNAAGDITARTIVWVNPADANDKRYIRIYGDSALRRRLEVNGYACKPFTGAKLRYIPHPRYAGDETETSKWVVAPYLDGPGGNGGGNYDGRYGVLEDDGIALISQKEAEKLNSECGHSNAAVHLQGSGGHYNFYKLPSNWYLFTSDLSGESFDKRVTQTEFYLTDAGTKGTAAKSELETGYTKRCLYGTGFHGVRIMVRDDAPLFTHLGDRFVDIPGEREYLGYRKLSAALYPSEQDWMLATNCDIVETEDGYIKAADAVTLITGDSKVTVHSSKVPQNSEMLWGANDRKVYAAPGQAFHTTPSGKKVHNDVHDVSLCFDGVWDFTRNCVTRFVFGKALVMRKGQEVFDLDVSNVKPVTGAVSVYARYGSDASATAHIRSMLTRSHYAAVWKDNAWTGATQHATQSAFNDPEYIRATLAHIADMTDEALLAELQVSGVPATAQSARWWVKSSAALLDIFDAKRAEYKESRPADPTNIDALLASGSAFSTARFSFSIA